jgi:hypothetical protein
LTNSNPELVEGLLPLPSGERIEVRGIAKAIIMIRGALKGHERLIQLCNFILAYIIKM